MTNSTVDEVCSKLESKEAPSSAGRNQFNDEIDLYQLWSCLSSLWEKSGSRDKSPSVAWSCRIKDFRVTWKMKVNITKLFDKTEGYLTFVMKVPRVGFWLGGFHYSFKLSLVWPWTGCGVFLSTVTLVVMISWWIFVIQSGESTAELYWETDETLWEGGNLSVWPLAGTGRWKHWSGNRLPR